MEKFLIILLPQRLYVYKSTNNRFEVLYINGEEILDWSKETSSKDFMGLKRELLDTHNYEDLSEIGFNIIYHQVDTDIIRQLSETLLPCAWWQVLNFERVLPDLLIKFKKIRPNESVSIEFEDVNYLVNMNSKGIIQSFLLDKKDLEIMEMLKINKNLNEENSSLKRKSELIEKELSIAKQEINKINKVRVGEVRILSLFKNVFGKEVKFKIEWKVANASLVYANTKIAEITKLYSDGKVESSDSLFSNNYGKILILGNSVRDIVENGEIVAIIVDPKNFR